MPRTKVSDLPSLSGTAAWDFVWGLNVKEIEEPEVVPDQPILQLTAIRSRDCNAKNPPALVSTAAGSLPDLPIG